MLPAFTDACMRHVASMCETCHNAWRVREFMHVRIQLYVKILTASILTYSYAAFRGFRYLFCDIHMNNCTVSSETEGAREKDRVILTRGHCLGTRTGAHHRWLRHDFTVATLLFLDRNRDACKICAWLGSYPFCYFVSTEPTATYSSIGHLYIKKTHSIVCFMIVHNSVERTILTIRYRKYILLKRRQSLGKYAIWCHFDISILM